MKRFFKYFMGSLLVILVLFFGSRIQSMLSNYTNMSFNTKPYLVFSTLFPIFVGMIIRLPQLVTDIINKKQWSVDWVKLFAIGIPSIYTALSPLTFLINVPLSLINLWNHLIFSLNLTMTSIAGVIFGYVFLDSLKEK